jgi:hypothetical protein
MTTLIDGALSAPREIQQQYLPKEADLYRQR